MSKMNVDTTANKTQEISKWHGMGFLMEPSEHLPELPEDVIIEIGSYLGDDGPGDRPLEHGADWVYTPTPISKFYYVDPMFYSTSDEQGRKKHRPRFVVRPSKKHRFYMRRVNIEFLKAYEIIKGRIYYRSQEYYESQEYKDDLAEEYEDRMRDAWKDQRDYMWD